MTVDDRLQAALEAGLEQRIDQTTAERAVIGAVERERVAWQRKLEQGRARFRRLVAALASTGQSLAKVKELLEETEREWMAPQTVGTAPDPPLNQQPERTVKPASDRVSLVEDSNGGSNLPLENAEF